MFWLVLFLSRCYVIERPTNESLTSFGIQWRGRNINFSHKRRRWERLLVLWTFWQAIDRQTGLRINQFAGCRHSIRNFRPTDDVWGVVVTGWFQIVRCHLNATSGSIWTLREPSGYTGSRLMSIGSSSEACSATYEQNRFKTKVGYSQMFWKIF